MRSHLFALLLAPLICPVLAHAQCFDVSKGEPDHLEGYLTVQIFAGPPNFEDVRKGDTPEPGYLLKLTSFICLTGDADFADPTFRFDEVQLVPTDATAAAMRALKDRDVDVSLENPMPAMTGHHHRPLVAWVKSISATGDPAENYGTAETTVEGFYHALELGDGKSAASFVIPEKTRKGPFSPLELSRFYGRLPEPLALIDVQAISPTEFIASYHFATASRECNGRALVRTENRQGRNLISGIKALNGC